MILTRRQLVLGLLGGTALSVLPLSMESGGIRSVLKRARALLRKHNVAPVGGEYVCFVDSGAAEAFAREVLKEAKRAAPFFTGNAPAGPSGKIEGVRLITDA